MGETFESISKEIGISKQTLLAWSRKFSIEIAGAKSRVLDNVIEEYDIAKSGRLKIVAKDMLRIDAELSKRDLASIPTSKLMQIKLKALEVAGDILDVKRIEVGGSIELNDSISRWERIVRECGIVEDEGYKVKVLKGNDDDGES
jgi:hypothetical protein